jgi:hypothetical protein
MPKLKRAFNYVGQLRIYSLADLAELLVVAGATDGLLRAAIMMHVGFLAFLEFYHEHEEREPVDWKVALITMWQGAIWFGSQLGEWYMFFSVTYAMKKHGRWALVSPFARGAQTFVVLYRFLPLGSPLLWAATLAMIVRNLVGDWRDVDQDDEEGLQTWPVVLGWQQDRLYLHLVATIATTWLWWAFGAISWRWPLFINFAQVVTYWWTPRPATKKAAQWLHGKILSFFGR